MSFNDNEMSVSPFPRIHWRAIRRGSRPPSCALAEPGACDETGPAHWQSPLRMRVTECWQTLQIDTVTDGCHFICVTGVQPKIEMLGNRAQRRNIDII